MRVVFTWLGSLVYVACAAAAVRDWYFERPTHAIPTLATIAIAVLAVRWAWRRTTADERSERAE